MSRTSPARLAIADNRQQAEEVAHLVSRYLDAHPDAADTLEGIARWWLTRQRFDDAREMVLKALDLLIERGRVEKRTMANGVTLFRCARVDESD